MTFFRNLLVSCLVPPHLHFIWAILRSSMNLATAALPLDESQKRDLE
jgi:hypothetical protein